MNDIAAFVVPALAGPGRLRVCAKINSGFAGGDLAFWRGATKEQSQSSVTEEQRSQKAKSPQPAGAGRRRAGCGVARRSQPQNGDAPSSRLASGPAALPPKPEVIFARTLRVKSVGRRVLSEPGKQQSLNGFAARRDGLALPSKILNKWQCAFTESRRGRRRRTQTYQASGCSTNATSDGADSLDERRPEAHHG